MDFKKANELGFDVRPQMGVIFADGFYDLGLKFLSKDKNKLAKALAHIFDLQYFYFAVEGNEIMGFTACCNGQPPLLNLDKKIMVKELGFILGRIAHIALSRTLLRHTYPFEIKEGMGTIEFVATSASHRGKGVGYALLTHVMETEQYSEYVLEVADTNAPAISLYERLGFNEFVRTPAPKRAGFNHFVYMKKEATKL